MPGEPIVHRDNYENRFKNFEECLRKVYNLEKIESVALAE